MTTKPSHAPWADEPFRLIATPSKRLDNSLGHVHCATEMAHAHNVILRGLNSILQQAPYVRTEHTKDVKDLLFYTQSWVKMVNHHHWVEETFIFPELEKSTGKKGIMDTPKHQHELFHNGIEKLLAFTEHTPNNLETYRWDGEGGMKEIIDSFGHHLVDHLYAEIDIFLGLGDMDIDGAQLKETWGKAEKIAQQNGNLAMLYDVFPTVLGCADKTYEGGHEFPPLPWILPYVVKYWFAAGNGAWRFNPCDWWGRPQPLKFGPS